MVAPDYFHNCLSLDLTVHCHNPRQSSRGDLLLGNVNTSLYGLKSIRYFGAKLWNELAITIIISPKKFLKYHILNAV